MFFVCKSGANSGHYTAYAKHPIKEEWYYFNDETTVKQEPHEADYSHAYVLFYQRKGWRNCRKLLYLDIYIAPLTAKAKQRRS